MARVLVFEPPHRVRVLLDIGQPGNSNPIRKTKRVEVRFIAESMTALGWSWSTETSSGTAPTGVASLMESR